MPRLFRLCVLFSAVVGVVLSAPMESPTQEKTTKKGKNTKKATTKQPAPPPVPLPGSPLLPSLGPPGSVPTGPPMSQLPIGSGGPNQPLGPPGSPASPLKLDTPWDEYRFFAGSFSMPVATGGGGGFPIASEFLPKAKDQRIQKSAKLLEFILPYERVIPKIVAGVRIRDEELPRGVPEQFVPKDPSKFLKEIPELVKDAFVRAMRGKSLIDDPASMSTFFSVAADQWGREKLAEFHGLVTHYLRLHIWWEMHPIFEEKAGAETRSPLCGLLISEATAPVQAAVLSITNQSKKDLHNVTLRLQTHFSRSYQGPLADFYVFIPEWKAGGEIPFSKTVVSKVFEIPRKLQGDVVTLSLWCDEARQVNLPYRFASPTPVRTQSPGPYPISSLTYRLTPAR